MGIVHDRIRRTKQLRAAAIAARKAAAKVADSVQDVVEEVVETIQETISDERVSTDMTAKEAAEYIEAHDVEELDGFLAEDEKRKTVLDAWAEKVGD